jgi:hypothetical protein
MNHKTNSAYSVPKPMQAIYEQIGAITDGLCSALLNDEYSHMCHKMAATLCRKRPSPLLRGKIEIWAVAIVHTVAGVNFAYDPSQTPHITLDQLCGASGTSKTTVGAKATLIRRLLKIDVFDFAWTLPSRMDRNPMVWMLTVNGFLVDIRTMPLDAQIIAFDKGLIPYIPALQPDSESSDG